VHLLDLPAAPPDPADLRRGGDNGHAGGDIDARQLVGNEKEQDGKEVE